MSILLGEDHWFSAALQISRKCVRYIFLESEEAMERYLKVLGIIGVCAALSACGDKTTGQACLGPNNSGLVEGMQSECKAGDAIATKHPAYFCDFNYAVAYNDYNSAMCIYSGKQKPERTEQ
ncbi:hypothetical protein [Alcanivorax sp. NBRC 101098]|uniref:hypothetical protein n=1 Tax=Alcanivorax sp. NBRC 101098 TaxID=1113728 RepID=UPI0018D4B213|nr:hypothetical protein [Alcanivorax sp. NBRC 101098]